MNNNLEFKGVWYLPNSPDKRVYGVLTYNKFSGSILELIGNFDDNDFLPELRNEDIILGVTTDSKEITLYKSFIIHRGGAVFVSGSETGITTIKYTVNYLFEGAHIAHPNDLKFDEISCHIRNLDEWLGISGFASDRITQEQQKNKEFMLKYKLPEQILFPINENVTGKFNFTIKLPSVSIFQKEHHLKQNVELVFSCKTGQDLELLLDYFFCFQNFLVLGMYSKTHPIGIRLKGESFTRDIGFENEVLEKKIIHLYLPISNIDEEKSLLLGSEMFFNYHQIKDVFPQIIKTWFEQYDKLKPALSLFFEQLYNNQRFSENTFLNLAQAAETFHTRTNNHTKIPKEKYKLMVNEVMDSVDKKYHGWLKEQFCFGNNLNLAQRLDEIISNTANPILDKIIGDKKLFADQIRWSRNYYTHYTKDSKKKALEGKPLFDLSEKIKIVLACAFLKQTGLPIEKIEEFLERNKRRLFNHLVTW